MLYLLSFLQLLLKLQSAFHMVVAAVMPHAVTAKAVRQHSHSLLVAIAAKLTIHLVTERVREKWLLGSVPELVLVRDLHLPQSLEGLDMFYFFEEPLVELGLGTWFADRARDHCSPPGGTRAQA